jgi:hypothetical protein
VLEVAVTSAEMDDFVGLQADAVNDDLALWTCQKPYEGALG